MIRKKVLKGFVRKTVDISVYCELFRYQLALKRKLNEFKFWL